MRLGGFNAASGSLFKLWSREMNANPKRVKRRGSRYGAPTNPNAKDKLAREEREAKRKAAKQA